LETANPPEKYKDVSEALGYNRFMLDNVWTVGTYRLIRDDMKEQRTARNRKFDKKRNMTRVLHKVEAESTKTCKFKDEVHVSDQPWTVSERNNFLEFYN
jgi:hypothetical protein